MKIKNSVPIEKEKKLSEIAKQVDKQGAIIVTENNQPKYFIGNIQDDTILDLTDEEKLYIIAKRILKEHAVAFRELAK